MSPLGALHLPAVGESLQPIFADRLQHHKARLLTFLPRLLQQALVDE